MRCILPALLVGALAGCAAPSIEVVFSGSDGSGFMGGAPFDPRPGTRDIAYLSGREILLVNRSKARLDHLLLDDASGMVDLAFRSRDELLVLTRGGVCVYFAGRLIRGWPLEVSHDALIAAGKDGVWIATNREGQGRILSLDPALQEFSVIAEFDKPVEALATGPQGCYLAFDDSVFRLVLAKDRRSADLVFVLALPGETICSIAPDLDHGILYTATPTDTWFYAKGRVRPFHLLGGVIRYDHGTLFISSGIAGSLIEIEQAHRVASDLEGG